MRRRAMPIEVEAKFVAGGREPLLSLATAPRLADATLGPAATVHEVDRYLDTEDGRLAAARWACRLRRRGDEGTRVSLKGPRDAVRGSAWHHRRPELEGPASAEPDPAEWPASEARDLVVSLSGGRPLHERVRLDQRRIERSVAAREGGRLGTLSLDHVAVSAGGRDLGELYVVELELAGASALAEEELERLAAALGGTPGLVAEPRTKLEHALERLDRA